MKGGLSPFGVDDQSTNAALAKAQNRLKGQNIQDPEKSVDLNQNAPGDYGQGGNLKKSASHLNIIDNAEVADQLASKSDADVSDNRSNNMRKH
jgi:hypothetical protein